MKDSLVSIIIPVYNVEKYLRRCVDSVLNQTYTNLEIILVDDGSPDSCPQICDEYLKSDCRIKVIHQNNQGLSAARNAGTAISKGLYLMYVDSDDFIDKRTVEILLTELCNNQAELSMCEPLIYNNEEDLKHFDFNMKSDRPIDMNVMNQQNAIDYLLTYPYARSAWGKLYKRTLIELLNYPAGKFAEDMFVIHKIFDKANPIVLVKLPLYFYNQEGVSLTRSQFDLKKLDVIEAMQLWCDFIKKRYPELYSKVMELYLSNLINLCTYLAVDKGEWVLEVYKTYRKTIKTHFYLFLKANQKYNRDKVKALMILLGIYPGYVRVIRNKLMKTVLRVSKT